MSVQRRTLLSELGCLCLGAVGLATPVGQVWAQRPAHPIARPPSQRPDRPLGPGRFNASTGGVPANPLPGLFTVVRVDMKAGTIQLRDDGGRSGTVHVDPDVIDLEPLKAGDLVEVDFLVPGPGSAKLEAAGIWKVQR
jgi:hypothetical protein